MAQELLKYVYKIFPGVDARHILCFAQIIMALIRERTVNLSKLSMFCDRKSKRQEARYRRLQRFIAQCPISQVMMARLVMGFFKGPVLLVLDRTNWRFGTFDINILVLSVVHESYSFPLFWLFISHKGCSSPEDRIDLMTRFIQAFGKSSIEAILGDREFIGPEWLGFLERENITFHMRLRNNIKIGREKGELPTPKNEMNYLKTLEKIDFPGKRQIGGKKDSMHCFVSACRSPDNDLVIIISNKEAEKSLDRYKLRWGIETLFGCLKTRGFCLEDTHLKDYSKISNLVLLLSFAFLWAFKIGEWLNSTVPIKLKHHNRKSLSFFRYGLNALLLAKNSFKKLFLLPLLSQAPLKPPKNLLFSIGYL